MRARHDGSSHKVLVVDDDRNLRKIISTNLELVGYEVTLAPSGQEALDLLEAAGHDLVLLDVMMPYMDGYEVAGRIRAHHSPTISHVPIIMITAKGETEDKLRGFEVGVDDYITKPFGSQELLARVRAKIRRVETDASLSPLTRLPGNLSIEEDLTKRIASNVPFALLYLDLDSFKAFNDIYGFAHGDEAIQLVANIATDTVRRLGTPQDFVGHIGGDDFIIATTCERADTIAAAIVEAFDRDIRGLYNAQDLHQGYIETRDRRGSLNRFPIMSLSIAVVTTELRAFTRYAEIGEVAAELKRYAKAQPGSVFVRDKRT